MSDTAKAAHTPGPWENADYHSRAGHPDAGFYIHMTTENGHFAIAKSYSGNVGADIAEANARLIAAAPDGLTANRLTVGALQAEYRMPHNASDDWIYDTLGPALSAAYFAARATISKATGTP